jgi:hypothetical protein
MPPPLKQGPKRLLHKISLADIYEMIPWERTVYNKLIKEYVAKSILLASSRVFISRKLSIFITIK